MPAWPEQDELLAQVGEQLKLFIDDRRAHLNEIGTELAPMFDGLEAFILPTGKRLRPAFAYWGWRGAGGVAAGADRTAIVKAVASLELIQACALIHDDVMDGSDTRRGQPSVHRRFARIHREHGWRGGSDSFGAGAAILLGDLALSWADSMLYESGAPADALRRAGAVYDRMRSELMAGQYLDLVEQARGGHSVERSLRVTRFKSGKYTVERPLHLGAAIAGAEPELMDVYSAYAVPLGEAFQLRDDILGVFGDPSLTGKPAGDDLREGKRTVLTALAIEGADSAQASLMHQCLGDPALEPASVDLLREVIVSTGALATTERMISERVEQAVTALTDKDGERALTEAGDQALRSLADAATNRTV